MKSELKQEKSSHPKIKKDEYLVDLIPIKPRRYVYHVSKPSHRLSIMFEGIKTFPKRDMDCYLAFVNNAPPWFSVGNFWPLPIDSYDTPWLSNRSNEYFYCTYDFWRIDTIKAGVNWYIDPYMANDCTIYYDNAKPSYFLCTPSIIPADALDLMEYDIEEYNRHLQVMKGGHPELIFSEFNRMVRYKRERESNSNIRFKQKNS